MYEIIPDLWICKSNSIKNLNMKNLIHINCSKDLLFFKNKLDEKLIKNNVVKLYYYITENIDKINNYLQNNEIVIISCETCETLSPLLINCFLIKYGKLNIQETILCLESKTGITIKDNIFFNTVIKKIYEDSKK